MICKLDAGRRIAALREDLGLTQAVFAEKLDVSAQAVSKWETGQTLPGPEQLLRISWMSRVSINRILDGSESADAVSGVDRSLLSMNELLVCPECGQPLKLDPRKSDGFFYACSAGHRFEVPDGVIYFNTREIPGEQWSLWFRNYDHYLQEQRHPGLPRYMEGEPNCREVLWREIEKLRPRTILDVACGTGSGIKWIIERVNWPVTVIMADLSHRVLKYNRRFFSEQWRNPYADLVYLACDCAALPLRSDSVDLVYSNGGFESMRDKMTQGFREAFRVLKPGCCAVYNISAVDDHRSENTIKWKKLYLGLDESYHDLDSKLCDGAQWVQKCESTGFKRNTPIKIYGEMPAPEGDVFPFENMVLRWMARYVVVSQK